MRFKEWLLEGEYGTSASGEVGGFNPVGVNSDDYTGHGIKSKYQMTDKTSPFNRRKKTNGLTNDGLPPGSTAGYGGGQRPRRALSGAV
jgi:hypothetical protein